MRGVEDEGEEREEEGARVSLIALSLGNMRTQFNITTTRTDPNPQEKGIRSLGGQLLNQVNKHFLVVACEEAFDLPFL